jgi:hypothetical protein
MLQDQGVLVEWKLDIGNQDPKNQRAKTSLSSLKDYIEPSDRNISTL